MRATLIFSLGVLLLSPAFAQEENAPLELGRPNAKPIELPKPDLMPPPNAQPAKKKAVKKAAPGAAAAATTAAPAPAPTAAPTTPAATPATPAAPPATATTTTPPAVAPAVPAKPAAPGKKKSATVSATSTEAAPAQPPEGSNQTSLRHRALLNFRFANIWAIRNSTNTGSFILSWDPVIYPWKRFNFGITLGATEFESENVAGRPAKSFVVVEYGASVSYYMSRVFLPELVIGQERWNEPEGASSNMLVAFNGNFLFRKRPLGCLDRIYVGLGSLRMDGGSTNLIRAGLGVRF